MNADKTVKISKMPFGKKFEDYPEDTVFIWDEDDEDDWEKEIEDDDEGPHGQNMILMRIL